MENGRFGYTQKEYELFKSNGWRFLLLFSLVCVCVNCCRLNLSAAIPVMKEAGFDTASLGIATGIFFWVYAAGQVVNGRLSDAFGTRKLILSACILTAAVNAAIGFTDSLAAITVLWAVNGIFQSMVWSPGVGAISRWWPSEKRGFAVGFAHAFNGLGQGICVLVVSAAFSIFGSSWESAFIYPAVLPVVAGIMFFAFTKEKPEDIGIRGYEEIDLKRKNEEELLGIKEERGKWYPFVHLLTRPSFSVWLILAFFVGIARYGLLTWIPYYYVDRFGTSISDGLFNTFIIPLGMAIGTLVVPWLTDKYCSDNRLPAVVFCSAASVLAVVLFYMITPGPVACILLFFSGFFIYAINGLLWTVASDMGGRVFSGTASGMLNFASYLGAGCQGFVFGTILDRLGWSYVFAAIGGGLLVICLVSVCFMRTCRE